MRELQNSQELQPSPMLHKVAQLFLFGQLELCKTNDMNFI